VALTGGAVLPALSVAPLQVAVKLPTPVGVPPAI